MGEQAAPASPSSRIPRTGRCGGVSETAPLDLEQGGKQGCGFLPFRFSAACTWNPQKENRKEKFAARGLQQETDSDFSPRKAFKVWKAERPRRSRPEQRGTVTATVPVASPSTPVEDARGNSQCSDPDGFRAKRLFEQLWGCTGAHGEISAVWGPLVVTAAMPWGRSVLCPVCTAAIEPHSRMAE